MSNDIISRELRRRKVVANDKAKATDAAVAQAKADAAQVALSPVEREEAILRRAAEERAATEAIVAKYEKQLGGNKKSSLQAAAIRAHRKEQAALVAMQDASRLAEPVEVKLVPGTPPTLQQLNAMSIARDSALRDDHKAAASEAGKAVYTALSGRPPRVRRAKHQRAAEAAQALDAAKAKAEAAAGK